jgi:hypothetical protein
MQIFRTKTGTIMRIKATARHSPFQTRFFIRNRWTAAQERSGTRWLDCIQTGDCQIRLAEPYRRSLCDSSSFSEILVFWINFWLPINQFPFYHSVLKNLFCELRVSMSWLKPRQCVFQRGDNKRGQPSSTSFSRRGVCELVNKVS